MTLMRIQTLVLAGLLFCGPVFEAHAGKEGPETWPTVVLPEVTTKVRLSNTDVNRLVCPEGLKDVVFSQEKGVKVKISGDNAFIKFQVVKKGDSMIYTEIPSEFHLVCGGDIYSLVGMPQRVPAQTIRLSSGKKQRVQQNLSLFNGMPLEKKVLTLIKQVYTDQVPESYTVKTMGRQVDLFPSLWVRLRREIIVEGEGLVVKEYLLSLKEGASQTRLSEREFLRSDLTGHPLAIAVEELLLQPRIKSRLFIVEHQNTDTPPPFVQSSAPKQKETTDSGPMYSKEDADAL